MLSILIWWFSGFLGIIFGIFIFGENIPKEVRIGHVVSLFFESWFGPVVWIILIMCFTCAEERPRWESKVIYRRKDK